MEADRQWRERYLQLASEVEADEARHQAAERELRRLLMRLCVASSGLDTMLDPHLNRVREAAREGLGSTLIAQAQELGDGLMKVQDERVRGDLLERLLRRAPLSARQAKVALRLWRQLAQSPGKASDSQLDELAGQLFGDSGSGDSGSGGKSGFLGRLLQHSSSRNTNELLAGIISSIAWPEGVGERINALKSDLQEASSEDAWMDVVREVSGMAATVFDRAHRDAQASSEFLVQLTERLERLDIHMSQEGERRDASQASGLTLGQAVREEVGDLSACMRGERTLPDLHRQVLNTLDRIQQHVSVHLDGETERREQAEQQATAMQAQLQDLEGEAFKLRRQVEESRQQAMRDALTGLPNRRALEARVSEELGRMRRFGESLALVVFDVDDFKQINDVFGHKAGDRALALIAQVLTEDLRETDFIARYGGEELVGLMSGSDADAALKKADELRARVAGAGMHSRNKPVRITLSAGVAMARDGDDFGRLFERADQAMYQAKRQGKNCCILAA